MPAKACAATPCLLLFHPAGAPRVCHLQSGPARHGPRLLWLRGRPHVSDGGRCAPCASSHIKGGQQGLRVAAAVGRTLVGMVCSSAAALLGHLLTCPPPAAAAPAQVPSGLSPSTAPHQPLWCCAGLFSCCLPLPLAHTRAGAFWPSTTGEPHHLMAFFNSTIRLVTATCGANSTAFSVAALHQVGGARWPGCALPSACLCSANSNLHLQAIIAMMGRHGALPRLHCLLECPPLPH